MKLILLFLIPFYTFAGTTELLLKGAIRQSENLIPDTPTCHSNRDDKVKSSLLPYPTNLDEAISKLEEIESICTNPEDQERARLEVLKAFNSIYDDFKANMPQLGITVDDFERNDEGEIEILKKKDLLLKSGMIKMKSIKTNLSNIQYYNGNEDEDLKAKLGNVYTRKDNPILKYDSLSDRCKVAKFAYLDAVWRLTTLKPSFEYKTNTLNDLLLSPKPELDEFLKYEQDKLRATWALKNFLTLKREDLPSDCATQAGYHIFDEAMIRFDSINDTITQKKPLGFALGMCGRSMTGHCFDSDEETRASFENCYSPLHRKALLEGNILNKGN